MRVALLITSSVVAASVLVLACSSSSPSGGDGSSFPADAGPVPEEASAQMYCSSSQLDVATHVDVDAATACAIMATIHSGGIKGAIGESDLCVSLCAVDGGRGMCQLEVDYATAFASANPGYQPQPDAASARCPDEADAGTFTVTCFTTTPIQVPVSGGCPL